MDVRELCAADAGAIAGLMAAVKASLADPSVYVVSDEARVAEKFRRGAFGFGVWDEGRLLAFFLFEAPGRDPAENPLCDLGETDPAVLDSVLLADSVAVAPELRGQGWASRLLAMGEREARERGFSDMVATVSPRNEASLATFEKAGYERLGVVTIAGGILAGHRRVVLAKPL